VVAVSTDSSHLPQVFLQFFMIAVYLHCFLHLLQEDMSSLQVEVSSVVGDDVVASKKVVSIIFSVDDVLYPWF